MKNKIAIIGSNGQLGSDISKFYGERAVNLTRKEIDVTNLSDCKRILCEIKPEVIINCAAYVRVDDAENCPLEAFRVNSIGSKNIAVISKELDATNVFISTDYVFNGTKKTPYNEKDCPDPINVYGMSKYFGECFTKSYSNKFYIFRVSSLFGVAGASGKGGNFVETVIKMAKKNQEIKLVEDVVMSPTYTQDVASLIKNILKKEVPSGIYHLNNSGRCSWYEFAETIFRLINLNPNIIKIKSKELERKAKRPMFSVLDNNKIINLGFNINEWEIGLKNYLKEKAYI